jgi:hypothetical protein
VSALSPLPTSATARLRIVSKVTPSAQTNDVVRLIHAVPFHE